MSLLIIIDNRAYEKYFYCDCRDYCASELLLIEQHKLGWTHVYLTRIHSVSVSTLFKKHLPTLITLAKPVLL